MSLAARIAEERAKLAEAKNRLRSRNAERLLAQTKPPVSVPVLEMSLSANRRFEFRSPPHEARAQGPEPSASRRPALQVPYVPTRSLPTRWKLVAGARVS